MSIQAAGRIDSHPSTTIGAVQKSPPPAPARFPMPLIPIDQVRIAPAVGAPNTDNPWGLAMKTGQIELSALFTRKKGEVTQCDKDGFIMKVEKDTMKIMADPARGAGHVQATQNGETMHGVITRNGNASTLRLDDGATITVTDKGRGQFTVSGIAPVTVNVKYVSWAEPQKPSAPDKPAVPSDKPWWRGQDPSKMSLGDKVKSYFKSLWETR